MIEFDYPIGTKFVAINNSNHHYTTTPTGWEVNTGFDRYFVKTEGHTSWTKLNSWTFAYTVIYPKETKFDEIYLRLKNK